MSSGSRRWYVLLWTSVRHKFDQTNIGPNDTVGVALPICVQDVKVNVLGKDA